MAVFLFIPGIKGGTTEKNHEGWVKVDSLQFGVQYFLQAGKIGVINTSATGGTSSSSATGTSGVSTALPTLPPTLPGFNLVLGQRRCGQPRATG